MKQLKKKGSGAVQKVVASPAEVARRVSWVELMLRQGPLTFFQLRRMVRKKYGVGKTCAGNYIVAARKRLVVALNQEREYHKAHSLAFYQGMQMDPKADPRTRIYAQERIDKLLGLDSPTKVEMNGDMQLTAVRRDEVGVEELDLPVAVQRQLLDAVRKKKIEKAKVVKAVEVQEEVEDGEE